MLKWISPCMCHACACNACLKALEMFRYGHKWSRVQSIAGEVEANTISPAAMLSASSYCFMTLIEACFI